MTILDTNTRNPEFEQAALWPFFDETIAEPSRTETAVLRAREEISPYVLTLITRCDELKSRICSSPEEAYDTKMELYDAQAAVRACAEQVAYGLQTNLPKGPHKLGNTMYFVIDDPHARTAQDSWLIMLEDNANVSFMEPRGLIGDDEFKLGGFEQHVQLIEDIISASQTV